jgi:hypothetical protein
MNGLGEDESGIVFRRTGAGVEKVIHKVIDSMDELKGAGY